MNRLNILLGIFSGSVVVVVSVYVRVSLDGEKECEILPDGAIDFSHGLGDLLPSPDESNRSKRERA